MINHPKGQFEYTYVPMNHLILRSIMLLWWELIQKNNACCFSSLYTNNSDIYYPILYVCDWFNFISRRPVRKNHLSAWMCALPSVEWIVEKVKERIFQHESWLRSRHYLNAISGKKGIFFYERKHWGLFIFWDWATLESMKHAVYWYSSSFFPKLFSSRRLRQRLRISKTHRRLIICHSLFQWEYAMSLGVLIYKTKSWR